MSHEPGLEVGIAAEGSLRWIAVDLTQPVEEARRRLDFSPVSAMAFGRAACAAAILLRMSVKVPRRLSVDVRGDGPMGRVFVEVDSRTGGLRGLVGDRHVAGSDEEDPVSAAIGQGTLRVSRQQTDGSLYDSHVDLITGGIGHDLAHYLKQSEQRDSAVLIGALAKPQGIVACGGVLIEALPGIGPGPITKIEAAIEELGSFSRALEERSAQTVTRALLEDLSPQSLETVELAFRCECSRERIVSQLAVLTQEQVADLCGSDGRLEADCSFCGEQYLIHSTELTAAN